MCRSALQRFLATTVAVVTALMSSPGLAQPEQWGQPPPLVASEMQAPLAGVAVFLDVSGSMNGQKLAQLKESTKLAIALLDAKLSIAPFDSFLRPSYSAIVSDDDSRRRAMAYVDQLSAGGGTNYVAPLGTLKTATKGTVAIFISDGENNTGTDDGVLAAVKNAPGPIFTVGIETTPKAQALLTRMAATTGGAAVRVERAEDLVNPLLQLVQDLCGYRAYAAHEVKLSFRGVTGRLIAIGYDATPTISGQPQEAEPVFRHAATLPRNEVLVSRVDLLVQGNIEISTTPRLSTTPGRLDCVLRNDLPRSRLSLNVRGGTAAAGGQIVATTDYTTSDGRPIDPRHRNDLGAGYLLQDEQGRTIAKVLARPSPSAPTLTASIPLPTKSGPVTVVQVTRDTSCGKPFDAAQQQTVLLTEPTKLDSEPAVLTTSAEVGRFEVAARIAGATGIPDKLETLLHSTSNAISLGASRIGGNTVTLEFEAKQPADFTGSVELTDPSGQFAPLSIPFRFTVVAKCLGLSLPKNADCGAVMSNTGAASLGRIPVNSLDDAAISYGVHAGDLSNGSHVVRLRCRTASVSPTKATPATVECVAEVGDVPPGVYSGSLKFDRPNDPHGRSWTLPLRLSVLDSLIAEPLNFGSLEPGGVREAKLSVRNVGDDVGNVDVVTEDVQSEGGLIELSAPPKLPPLPSKTETAVVVKLSVSPLISARGAVDGAIRLRRANGVITVVPLRLELVDEGKGDSPLIVSPDRVELTARPVGIVKFELSMKLEAGTFGAKELTITAGNLVDTVGVATDSAPEFQWLGTSVVASDRPALVQGFVVAPSQPGVYRSDISVAAANFGTKVVPLTLRIP